MNPSTVDDGGDLLRGWKAHRSSAFFQGAPASIHRRRVSTASAGSRLPGGILSSPPPATAWRIRLLAESPGTIAAPRRPPRSRLSRVRRSSPPMGLAVPWQEEQFCSSTSWPVDLGDAGEKVNARMTQGIEIGIEAIRAYNYYTSPGGRRSLPILQIAFPHNLQVMGQMSRDDI